MKKIKNFNELMKMSMKFETRNEFLEFIKKSVLLSKKFVFETVY